MCASDSVLSIGDISAETLDGDLSVIASFVHAHTDQEVTVVVRRWEGMQQYDLSLTLVPQSWEGRGLLGCDLVPWVEPKELGDDGSASFGDSELDRQWNECWEAGMPSLVHAAAYLGHMQLLQYLAEWFEVDWVAEDGRTAIFYAASMNQLDCLILLLSYAPEQVDVCDNNGDTPLHASCTTGAVDATKFLLESEADRTIANSRGWTPAHVVSTEKCLNLLLECDSGSQKRILGAVDLTGKSVLFTAVESGHFKTSKLLCEHNPELLGVADRHGDTPLHVAAGRGRAGCVKLLLQKGADRGAANTAGQTPSDAAGLAGHSEIQAMLDGTSDDELELSVCGEEHESDHEWSVASPTGNSAHWAKAKAAALVGGYMAVRWTVQHDPDSGSVYYEDSANGTSQWERPEDFDGQEYDPNPNWSEG